MSTILSSHSFIVIGDLHDKAARIVQIPELKKASGVIITGDLTNTGGVAQARKILDAIAEHTPTIFAQIGNMDRPEVTDYLNERGCNIHAVVRPLLPDALPDIGIMGLGGSPFTPFGTPSEFPEARLAEWLDAMWQQARAFKRVVFVAHAAPFETACDVISSGAHVGSKAVKDFILDKQPDICLCGHIHESRAIDQVGRTHIVNPGALADGGYAVLTASADSLMFSRHEW